MSMSVVSETALNDPSSRDDIMHCVDKTLRRHGRNQSSFDIISEQLAKHLYNEV